MKYDETLRGAYAYACTAHAYACMAHASHINETAGTDIHIYMCMYIYR